MSTKPSLLDLRLRAESRLSTATPSNYELELHKLELEMQNEELCRVHAELERTMERYRLLFDAAPIAYLTLGISGRIYAVNRAVSELTGIAHDELVGMRLSALMAAPDADRLHVYLCSVDEHGSDPVEVELQARSGELRRVRVRSTLAIGEDRYLVTLSPVEERVVAGHARDLRNLLQHVHDMLGHLRSQIATPEAGAILQQCADSVSRGARLATALAEREH